MVNFLLKPQLAHFYTSNLPETMAFFTQKFHIIAAPEAWLQRTHPHSAPAALGPLWPGGSTTKMGLKWVESTSFRGKNDYSY